MSYAWRRTTASPPGPVLLDFPIEVLFSPVHHSRISWGSLGAPLAYPPGPHPAAIDKAAELIKNSKRPIIVTGSGARKLNGDGDFLKFVEAVQIPVFASNKHSSPLPVTANLRCGSVSRLSALKHMDHPQPDLVLVLGARSGMFFGSRSESSLPSPETTKYIHVDVDAAELGRMIPLDLGITSDVVTAIKALSREVQGSGYQASSSWVKATTALKMLPMPWENEPEESVPGRMHPYHAIKAVFNALPPGSIITVGT